MSFINDEAGKVTPAIKLGHHVHHHHTELTSVLAQEELWRK